MRVLQRALNLERLLVEDWAGSFERNSQETLSYPRPPSVHTSLRHLELTWDHVLADTIIFPILLGFLTLPSLETFNLYASAWIEEEVIALLEGSSCRLKKLITIREEDDEDEAFPGLSALLEYPSLSKLLERQELQSSLEELVIGRSALDNRTLDILIPSPSNPICSFPALRRISFMDGMVYRPFEFDPGRFARLVE